MSTCTAGAPVLAGARPLSEELESWKVLAMVPQEELTTLSEAPTTPPETPTTLSSKVRMHYRGDLQVELLKQD